MVLLDNQGYWLGPYAVIKFEEADVTQKVITKNGWYPSSTSNFFVGTSVVDFKLIFEIDMPQWENIVFLNLEKRSELTSNVLNLRILYFVPVPA